MRGLHRIVPRWAAGPRQGEHIQARQFIELESKEIRGRAQGMATGKVLSHGAAELCGILNLTRWRGRALLKYHERQLFTLGNSGSIFAHGLVPLPHSAMRVSPNEQCGH